MTNRVDIPRASDSAHYITEYRDRSLQARRKRGLKSLAAATAVLVLFFTGFAISRAAGITTGNSGRSAEASTDFDSVTETGAPADGSSYAAYREDSPSDGFSDQGYYNSESLLAAEDDSIPDISDAEMAESGTIQKVYLTFDDGPSENTSKILDILDEYGVKATFFVLGREDGLYDDIYRRIVNEGHTLGMHSFTHRYGEIYSGVEAFVNDLRREREFLGELTGVYPDFYRFPGGSSNSVGSTDIGLLIACLEKEGITFFDWNVSSGDATGYGIPASTILRNATRLGGEERAVILFHDGPGKGTTVEALPQILRELLSRGNVEILPITEYTEPVRHVQ